MSGPARPVLLFIVIAAMSIFAPSGYSAGGEPRQGSGHSRSAKRSLHQVRDPTDQVDGSTDQVNDQVDDTTDQVNDQVDDTTDQVDQQSDRLGDATSEATAEVGDASGEQGGGSTKATNRDSESSSDVGGVAEAANDVSGDDNSSAATGGDDPAPGLLAFTGTQVLVLGTAAGLLLIGLGVVLVSRRRRGRQRATA
jgi:hypothetical protein